VTGPVITAHDILHDAFGRVHESLPGLVEGMGVEDLLWRPDPEANPVGWLVWHLSRVQDDHMAELGGTEQAWTKEGWVSRFDLPYDTASVGYGQSSDEVGAFGVTDPSLLTGYHEAVHRLTESVLDGLDPDDLSRVVDERWDPPVTAAVRLVSVVNDISQHLGQVGYVAGLARRR
jgi:Protein of unknown function (DUF664)